MASRTLDAEVGKSSGSCRTCAEEEQAKSDAATKVDRMPKNLRRKDPFGRWIRADTLRGIQFFKEMVQVPPAPGTLQLYNRPDILDIKSSYASADGRRRRGRLWRRRRGPLLRGHAAAAAAAAGGGGRVRIGPRPRRA